MQIKKGTEYSLSALFKSKGSPAIFNVAPNWAVYNSSDKVIVSGTASQSGNNWVATFTIPTTYVVTDGRESLVLQFDGKDSKNASFVKDVDLTLVDEDENFIPNGVIYDAMGDSSINDVLLLDENLITSLSIEVYSPIGEKISGPYTSSNVSPSSTSSKGYFYNLSIPALSITENTFNDPYNIIIKYTTATKTDFETHPLYILDYKSLKFINSIKLFIDKSQLIEIDESLQWQLSEIMQGIMEGIKVINASPPENTFWTLKDIPSAIDSYINIASLIYILNTRYMAEGLNAFEFNGLNTSLSYNRTDFLANKISELQSQLDRLPEVKKSSISIAGKGTPPAGEDDNRIKNLGALGLTVNPLNNKSYPGRANRLWKW